MGTQLNSENTEVAITKANTPQECLLKGIDTLGGISTVIEEGDKVFIKFNLNLPWGFPTNTNFDVLVTLIELCKEVKVDKIFIGSFPLKGITINQISKILNLKEFFREIGAELVFLDKSNLFDEKQLKEEELNKIKKESFSIYRINNVEYLVPKVILESNKVIAVNQINVNPIFKITSSLLNSSSILSPKYQELGVNRTNESDYVSLDLYKTNLISNILEIYTIRKPNLVINDLFYILEGAGPLPYKDSNLKKTNLMVCGKDAVSVDLITLKLLNIEVNEHELIKQAVKRDLGISDINKITILGEDLEENEINVDLCLSRLEDINIKNFRVNTGNYCSGCFKSAYHLLNFMKTNLVKDLKYNPNNVFLMGQNPPEPENFENILLFGDCAINSTKNNDFRTIKIESKKNFIDDTKDKILQKQKSGKKRKIKIKPNKKILELPGCPPDISDCIALFMKYYGKSNMPNLSLFKELFETWFKPKVINNLKALEVL